MRLNGITRQQSAIYIIYFVHLLVIFSIKPPNKNVVSIDSCWLFAVGPIDKFISHNSPRLLVRFEKNHIIFKICRLFCHSFLPG